MRKTLKKRSGRKEVETVGPSGTSFAGHTSDGPIWEPKTRIRKRKRAGIPPEEADQSMVERNIPIDWERKHRAVDEANKWEKRCGPRVDTTSMTMIPVNKTP